MTEQAEGTPALYEADLRVVGRILPASNATLLAELGDTSVRAVYKPVSGERPLWDFPHGTLAGREVAAYLLSEALGWGIVPPTVLRDGPAGPGMVQLFVDTIEAGERPGPVDLVPEGACPPGYRHVLSALDAEDRPVDLVHEDSPGLRRMAVFDVVVNNGDRKGGHVLAGRDGRRYGVDHGVSMSVEPKLRTVLWGWAGEPLDEDDLAAVHRVGVDLAEPGSPLRAALADHVTSAEIEACRRRCDSLVRRGVLPFPDGGWPAIPWPAF